MVPVKTKQLVMPSYSTFWALFIIASGLWLLIVFAWLVVFVSILCSWEVPASGAVLVCAALIADIIFENYRWRKLPCDPSGSISLVPDAVTGKPILITKYMSAPAGKGRLGALLSLAKGDEVKREADDTWYYNDTVRRVEKIILLIIVITALFGTALWGYGHLLFK